MTNPVRFCRYRSLNGQSGDWVRDSILHGKHYFASPLSFNDPLDCRPNFVLNGSKAQLQKYYEGLVARHMPELGREARRAEARRRVSDPEFDPRLPKNIIGFRQMYHETVTAHVGVMCLSEVHDDILMWAHYGDSHHGVCLVFDPTEPLFATAQPVHYKSIRPVVNPLVNSREEMLDAAMFTKSDHWAYEKEWRMLQYKRGAGLYTVPDAALVQVVLGSQVEDADRQRVLAWASESARGVAVTQATLSSTKFAVEVPSAWHKDA